MQSTTKKQKKLNYWGEDNPEKLKSTPQSANNLSQQLKSLVNPTSMIEQIFGTSQSEKFQKPPIEHKNTADTRKEYTVFSFSENRTNYEMKHEMQTLLNELKNQINAFEKAEKSLSTEIAKVKVSQVPEKAGIYYIRFFEWLLTVIKQLRMKVEESQAWLMTFSSRKKKKGYWQMYKKHGTTFGLSHERTLATQTG
jgi:hypothetical protein